MEYQLFNMCPFAVASIGGGGSFGGVGSESYTWTHYSCLESNCKLWIYKLNEKGEVCAEGCSLQFIGLNKDEINKNFEIKNKIIAEANAKTARIERREFCESCKYGKSRLFGPMNCGITGKLVSLKDWCEKYE
jgi:hypothetical protein